jgi:hypothetical protein
MGVLDIFGWSFAAAAAAWGLTLYWANLALSHMRASMQDEVEYWQAEAVRARELAAQVRHEIATWSRGARQGREDVMAIMPLLVAAQERLSGASADGVAKAEV